jgi:hypothetical protein
MGGFPNSIGGEGESFAVPLKIRATGFAGGSAEETENVRWLFPLLGEEGQGEGGLKNQLCIRDTIFNELQARAPHPLPEYTRPMKPAGKS